MKEKLEELRKAIKAKLVEAEKLVEAGKFDEAKVLQAEVKTLSENAKVMAEGIALKDAEDKVEAETKATKLEAENEALKVAAKKPARLPFETGEEKPADGASGFATLKYGAIEPAVKAVIADLYGSDFNYNEAREAQMKAFVKYVRFGEGRLTLQEQNLLHASAKTVLLRPDIIKAEVETGRTVAEIKATLEEGSNDLGGFLVPEDYRAEIIKRLMGNTVVRGRARVVTTTRDAIEWPRLEGGNTLYTSAVRVTWVDETPASATASETNPTWGLVRIPVHTVMARTNLSRNLLEDSAFNLLDVMAGMFADAMGIDEDAQFLLSEGDGTPQGVLGTRGNGAQAAPITGVATTNSGNATAITADALVQLVYSVASQYRNNAVLVMSRTTQRDIRLLKDGESRYMWQPSLTAGQPATLLGFPVLESESMDAIAANAYPIIFGDWGSGYIIADRVGMSVERVTDATTTGQNQIALFARRRLGGQCVSPWAFGGLKIST